jgi:hypothetical protein
MANPVNYNDLNVYLFKLINGEDIIALHDNNPANSLFEVHHPMKIFNIQTDLRNTSWLIQDWYMDSWKDTEVFIRKDGMVAFPIPIKSEELKKLEIKVYEPLYLDEPSLFCGMSTIEKNRLDNFKVIAKQHNAMEEYKYKLSRLNDGWFPDWNDSTQKKGFLYFSVCNSRINCDWAITIREHSDYEYFNPEIADQVLRELGNLWKRGKGIE